MENIALSFDPAACVLASIGTVIALIIYRRSFSVVVSLSEFTSGLRGTMLRRGMFQHFSVVVQNLGTTLYTPKVWLCIQGYKCTYRYQLVPFDGETIQTDKPLPRD